MATLMTHAITGYTIARICVRQPIHPIYWFLALTVPMLPDLDVLSHRYGLRYEDCWGHRGASHSLFIAFLTALVLVVLLKLLTRLQGSRQTKDAFWGLFLGMSSHGLLDALTNGGLGVATFWPLHCQRYFFPVRPLEVSPLRFDRFLEQAFYIMKNEFYYVWIPCLGILFLNFLYQRHSIRARH